MDIKQQITKLKEKSKALCSKRKSVLHSIKYNKYNIENGCKEHRDNYQRYLKNSRDLLQLNLDIQEIGKEICKLREELKNDKIQNTESN